MRVDLFDFSLPAEQIALRPLADRKEAKLLHVNPYGLIKDHKVKDLPALLRAGDVLVFNDTKVIPARLKAWRERNGLRLSIDVTLHYHELENHWRAFLRPLKRVKLGEKLVFYRQNSSRNLAGPEASARDPEFFAILQEKYIDGSASLAFSAGGAEFDRLLRYFGVMPLPPYIAQKRQEDEQDERDYQTIFAKHQGAIASPTAGLHFTEELLNKLREQSIDSAFVTLHVGPGTFFPVKVEDTNDHKMHSEYARLDSKTAAFLNEAKKQGRRIIAVGTTSLRVLESAAIAPNYVEPYSSVTDIFITPGYRFRFIDGLITNFHLPRSTLFMLVAGLIGLDKVKESYKHAIKEGYRFYSYGDSSFLERSVMNNN